LFDASANPQQIQTFRVAGLKNPASATIYSAAGLEQGGMPLGGLGTGYLCIDPDGRLANAPSSTVCPRPWF